MSEEHRIEEQSEKKEAVRELVTVLRAVGDDTFDRMISFGLTPEDAKACTMGFGLFAKKLSPPSEKKGTAPSAEKAASSAQKKQELPERYIGLDELLLAYRPICPYCGSVDTETAATDSGCAGAFSSVFGFFFIVAIVIHDPAILLAVILIGAGIGIVPAIITAVARENNKNMMKCRKCGKIFKYDRGKK